MPLPSLISPPLGNYHVRYQQKGPHEGEVRALEVSPGGKWLLSSSAGPGRNLLVLTDVREARVHGIVDMGHKHVTCLAWAGISRFVAGCSDGIAYLGRVQAGGHFLALFPIPVLHSPQTKALKDSILAISFDCTRNLLILACGREVHVMQLHTGATSVDKWWSVIHRITPFDGLDGNITCMKFFGRGKSSLFVGGTSGFVVYSVQDHDMRMILANYDHGIGNCAISPDGWYLAASTLDHAVVVWTLRDSGPVIHSSVVVGLPRGTSDPGRPSLPPVVITECNAVVAGTATGYLHFFSALTREKSGRLCCGDKYQLQALTIHEKRLYAAALDSNSGNVNIICYTPEMEDRLDREEAVEEPTLSHQPYIQSLEQVIFHLPLVYLDGDDQIVVNPRLINYIVGIFIAGAVVVVAAFWFNCIDPIRNAANNDMERYSEMIAYAGMCFIHLYIPRPLMAVGIHVLTFALYVGRALALFFNRTL